jgi:hypothetical protein
MSEKVESVQGEPERKDHSLFGLFGKKKEEKVGRSDDQMMPAPATHTKTQNPTQKMGLVDKIKQKLPGRRKK